MNSLSVIGSPNLLYDLQALDAYHRQNNNLLRRIAPPADGPERSQDFASFFPLPVEVFKEGLSPSVPASQIYTWVNSSGTQGKPSRIPLDKETSRLQVKASSAAFGSVLGNARRPLFIVDSSEILERTNGFSARSAGTLAMLRLSSKAIWLLDNGASDNERKYSGNSLPAFVFGFTYMVFQNLILRRPDLGELLQGSTLIHGGGWKKLESQRIVRKDFYKQLKDLYGFERILDYYGMVEQLGSVWLESPSEDGVFLPTKSAGAIIRDPATLEVVSKVDTVGLIQLFSTIPRSYPGHSVLTGDLGMLTYTQTEHGKVLGLKVIGRMPSLQPRGCSDAVMDTVTSLI